MSTKSENPRNFQNFLKRKFYDLRVFHSMFKTSPNANQRHRERVFFVYGVPINDARIDTITYAMITGGLH